MRAGGGRSAWVKVRWAGVASSSGRSCRASHPYTSAPLLPPSSLFIVLKAPCPIPHLFLCSLNSRTPPPYTANPASFPISNDTHGEAQQPLHAHIFMSSLQRLPKTRQAACAAPRLQNSSAPLDGSGVKADRLAVLLSRNTCYGKSFGQTPTRS